MHASARVGGGAGALAGIVAGVVATIAQVLLWLAFTDALPAIFVRDARMAAAIVLGEGALSRPDDDPAVLAVATIVHFALSIAYGVAIGCGVHRLRLATSIVAGGALGAALFAVNMFGFTRLWPWFEAARDGITFVAHLVFGVTAAWTYHALTRIRERNPSA